MKLTLEGLFNIFVKPKNLDNTVKLTPLKSQNNKSMEVIHDQPEILKPIKKTITQSKKGK